MKEADEIERRAPAEFVVAAAKAAGEPVTLIASRSRERRVVPYRHAGMFLAHREGHSMAAIARAFGGRDPTTVLAAVRNVREGAAAAELAEVRIALTGQQELL
jgi:chromosomal replication initiation ATPase DnaA